MSANMVTAAVYANLVANMPGATAQQQTSTDISFASVLNEMSGTLGLTDATQTQGASWRDIQNAMLSQAMGALSQNTSTTTDPVLAGLLQMMKELAGDGAASDASSAELLKLVEQMQKRLRELMEQNGAEMAGQEALAVMNALSQTMFGMPVADPAMQAFNTDGGATALQVLVNSEPADVLAMMYGRTIPSVESAVQAQAETVFPPVDAAGQAAGQSDVAGAVANAGEEIPQTQVTVQTDSTAVVHFQQAVQAAKQAQPTVDDGETAAPKQGVDLDELQKQVDSGVYLRNTAAPESAMSPQPIDMEPLPVATQLQEGIQTGMASGAGEVTVKLNPEELGEVTIRLTRTEDGMVLNIVARNAETQKMLANEMDALKDAMRPLKVEVESIVTQRQQELLDGQQQFGGQHQRSWSPMHGAAYYGDEPLGGSEEAVVQQLAASPQSMLNTYV